MRTSLRALPRQGLCRLAGRSSVFKANLQWFADETLRAEIPEFVREAEFYVAENDTWKVLQRTDVPGAPTSLRPAAGTPDGIDISPVLGREPETGLIVPILFNTTAKQFPSDLIASIFSFDPREYFEAPSEAKAAPKVES